MSTLNPFPWQHWECLSLLMRLGGGDGGAGQELTYLLCHPSWLHLGDRGEGKGKK